MKLTGRRSSNVVDIKGLPLSAKYRSLGDRLMWSDEPGTAADARKLHRRSEFEEEWEKEWEMRKRRNKKVQLDALERK